MINYVLCYSGSIENNASLLISEISFDIGVWFGYIALNYLAYRTEYNCQISLSLKINKEEDEKNQLQLQLIIIVQFFLIIVKNTLSAYYNTTLYYNIYLFYVASSLFYLIYLSWSSFFRLRSLMVQSMTMTNSSKSNGANPMDSFMYFLIYLTVGLLIGIASQLFSGFQVTTSPTDFFDPSLYQDFRPPPAIVELICILATYYFWKSPSSSYEQSTHSSNETDKKGSNADKSIRIHSKRGSVDSTKINVSGGDVEINTVKVSSQNDTPTQNLINSPIQSDV